MIDQGSIKIKYRPEIDGLRAIAIISVVLFHAFPSSIKSGYIGVDIFFVISGFLISTIINNELKNSKFSFVEFYFRRMRRIFPSFIMSVVITTICGYFLLFDNELKALEKQIQKSLLFVVNITFYRESGYFDLDAISKPLLNLWSLSIEEQFYIIFPLLLFFRSRKKLFGLIFFVIFTTSIFLNFYLINTDQKATFFLIPTRFWEFMVGYYAAILPNLKFLGRYQPYCGIFLIFLALVLIDSNANYPGYWATLPTVGTALTLNYRDQNHIFCCLSYKPVVYVGLISFPLYLLHWPALSFAHIINGADLPLEVTIVTIIFSILLSILFFECIEKKFKKLHFIRVNFIALLSLPVIAYLFSYILGSPFKTYQIKASGDTGHVEFYVNLKKNYFSCFDKAMHVLSPKSDDGEITLCFQSKSGEIDAVLVGDSHAEHLFLGFADSLPDRNIGYYYRRDLPLLTNSKFSSTYKTIIQSKVIKDVIITADWHLKLDDFAGNFEKELQETVNALSNSGKNVYLVQDVPTFNFDPTRCKYTRLLRDEASCSGSISEYLSQTKTYESKLQTVARATPNTHYIELSKELCSQNVCSMRRGDALLYRDNNHLNINGSKLIGSYIAAQMKN